MPAEKIETLVVGAGQAGIAMSEHLHRHRLPHLVLERGRIAERWRSERWDSLVANGPAWHDRFPGLTFPGLDPHVFAPRQSIVEYFAAYADQVDAPIRCGIEATALHAMPGGGFQVETTGGTFAAANVVVATGPFQCPLIPAVVPEAAGITQIHSSAYRNPAQLPPGGVMVVGAGSSGVQIAEELLRAGRTVHLSVGPHNRPPRAYRGLDFVWWLGALGKWGATRCEPGREHITIAVSGARGGHTVDFRHLAAQGMVLTGRAETFRDGTMHFAPDLLDNIALGDADYLSVLDEADAHAAREGLDLPEDPAARTFGPALPNNGPAAVDLRAAGIATIVWATGYALDFGWVHAGSFEPSGRPVHDRGVSPVPGLYFLGLPWLTSRSSAFIWGAWRDAEHLARQIAARMAAENAEPMAVPGAPP